MQSRLEEYIESALKVDFLIDAIKAGLLRDIVEHSFELLGDSAAPQAKANRILTSLFSKLVEGFAFDQFLAKIPTNEQAPFVSDLLYHIYYLNFAVEQLVNRERLTFYFFQILAVKASDETIRHIFSEFTFQERMRLYAFCILNFDEGSQRLFSATPTLWKIFRFAPSVQLAHWIEGEPAISEEMLKTALLEVQQNVKEQVAEIANVLQCTEKEVQAAVDIFGLYGHQVEDNLKEYDSLADKIAHCEPSSPFLKAFYRHVSAISHTPDHYRKGIEMITYALPTRGKELRLFPWLQSILEAVRFFSGYFQLEREIPIFVFDQSAKELFEKNADYIRRLQAPIIHIDSETMIALAEKLEIRELLVTDGAAEFGFAGARNAIFLLTPLLKYYRERKIDYRTLSKEVLRQDFNDLVLEEKRGPVVIHMGDDDVYVPPSAAFSDALFAYEHQNEYFCRYGALTGRDTSGMDTTLDLKALLLRLGELILQHKMQREPFMHGMATLLSKPKLCLNVPFGAEEVYLLAMQRYHFDFRELAIHLSGYRFPDRLIPEQRFSGLAELLRAHYRYIFGMRLIVDLIDPPNRQKRGILPWNLRKKPFKNLLQAIDAIVRPSTIEKMQKGYRRNFKALRKAFEKDQPEPEFATLMLKALDTFNAEEVNDNLADLRLLFQELADDAKNFKEFLAGKRQGSGKNFTHALALLTHVIENATFQRTLKKLGSDPTI